MNSRHGLSAALLAVALGALVSCGGGGGAGDVASSGIGGTGQALGTISGFGSVFVNGVEYETTDTSIIADDVAVGEAGLSVGMVVRVSGDVNADGLTGTATSITYDEAMQGPVNGAPAANADDTEKTLDIYGVNVIAKSNGTVYEGTSYATLAANDLLEVSGFYDAGGNLHATRIERKGGYPAATQGEITGTIVNLDSGAMTFGIQGTGITVSYGGAVDLSDVSGGVLANGLYVEAKGTLTSHTALTASKVEDEDEGLGDDVDEASVEGIVSGYISDASFRIAGVPVNASGASREPASLVLADGLRVKAEGAIVGGTLIAEEVSAESGEVKLYANVSTTNAAARTVTLMIPGMTGSVTVAIDNRTEIEDELGSVDSPAEVFGVTAGTFVRIEGYESAGIVTAKQFKIDTADKYLVQGLVDAWDGGSNLTVLGLSFSTAAVASFQRENDTNYANAAAFYTDLDVGTDVVKAVDTDRDGTVDEVEYEG